MAKKQPSFEEKLLELLGLKPGAISPMGLIFDKNHELTLLIDRDLQALPKICFHPLVNTESLAMETKDFFETFLESRRNWALPFS